jgi:hypothetical protein
MLVVKTESLVVITQTLAVTIEPVVRSGKPSCKYAKTANKGPRRRNHLTKIRLGLDTSCNLLLSAYKYNDPTTLNVLS